MPPASRLLRLVAFAVPAGLAMAAVQPLLGAAAGALFSLSTLGGYLLTVWFGLFGFREVRTTAGIVAGVIEIAAFAVLAALALTPGPQHAIRGPQIAWLRDGLPRALPRLLAGVGAVSVLALILLGVAVAVAATAHLLRSPRSRPDYWITQFGGLLLVLPNLGMTEIDGVVADWPSSM